MKKSSNYNPYLTHITLDGETTPFFHGLKVSNRMGQQLQLHQCNQFLKFLKPLSHHLDYTIKTQTTLNPDDGRMHSRISRMLLTPRLSNRTAPLMNYEMRWEQASIYKPNQFQTSKRWWVSLLLQFKLWQWLLRKANFQVNQCLILKECMK